MYFLKEILLGLLLAGLTACATVSEEATKHDNDYLRQGQSVATTKLPQNLNTTNMQSYYPIPPVTMGPVQQPSLVPPGSQMAQVQHQAIVQNASTRTSSVIASSANSLVLNVPYEKAWADTGAALRSSGYKVMQQDKGMGAFYVLDLAGTGGKLKVDTPIYQIHLKPSGNNTSVSLYDDKGNLANPAVGGRILGALKRNL